MNCEWTLQDMKKDPRLSLTASTKSAQYADHHDVRELLSCQTFYYCIENFACIQNLSNVVIYCKFNNIQEDSKQMNHFIVRIKDTT